MQAGLLGRTGIAVGRLILGCGNFGGVGSLPGLIGRGLDERAAFETLDEAAALGLTLLDTACSYAGGASERMIGHWLARHGAELRRGVRIATKVGTVVCGADIRIDLSPRTMADQLQGSLERLGLQRVDLCLSHAPDEQLPIEETLEGFAALIEAGKVGHIGACNISAVLLRQALDASARLGLPRYEWVQNAYNLMQREDEAELFAVCREHGLGLTPFSPTAGGVLTGKYRRDAAPPDGSRLSLRSDGAQLTLRSFDAIDELRRRAEALGASTGALALAWVMSHRLVTAPIVGPARTGEHLQLAREALALELDEAARDELAALFEVLSIG